MILYAVSLYNPDLDTRAKMETVSRCLYLACNPGATTEYDTWNVFPVYSTVSDEILGVKTYHEMQIADKTKIAEFLDAFSISETEKTTKLDSFANGDTIPFSQIQPSVLDLKTYEELVALGILEGDS